LPLINALAQGYCNMRNQPEITRDRLHGMPGAERAAMYEDMLMFPSGSLVSAGCSYSSVFGVIAGAPKLPDAKT
jgi:hypothetical protein